MASHVRNPKHIFILLTVLIYSAVAQYSCKDFANGSTKNFTINYTFDGIIESEYISDIEDAEVQNTTLLEAYVDDKNYLTVYTSRSFKEYDGDDYIKASLIISCQDGDYTVDYFIQLKKVVCTGLEFNELSYTYVFYDNLPAGYEFDLNDFENIFVTCAESSVTFDIEENDYFAIENDGSSNHATLRLKEYIEAPFAKAFNITARDDANPDHTAWATLTIKVFETAYLRFRAQSYYGVINQNSEIIIDNGPIMLEADGDSEEIDIVISPDYSNFFDVEFFFDEVNLLISADRALYELNESSIALTLTAYDHLFDNSAETKIILNVTDLVGNIEEVTTPSSEELTTVVPEEDDNSRTDDDSQKDGDDGQKDDDDSQKDDNDTQIDDQDSQKDDEDSQKDDEDSQKDDDDSQKDDEDSQKDDDDSQKDDDDSQKDDDDSQKDDEDSQKDDDDSQKDDDDTDGDDSGNNNVDYDADGNVVVVSGDIPLRGFDLWISHTRAVTVIMTVLSIFIIVSAIIYIRSRTPPRRHYMY